jgi:hypothetical protein
VEHPSKRKLATEGGTNNVHSTVMLTAEVKNRKTKTNGKTGRWGNTKTAHFDY